MQDEQTAPSAEELAEEVQQAVADAKGEGTPENPETPAEPETPKAIAEMRKRIQTLVWQREEEKRQHQAARQEMDELRRQFEAATKPREEQIPTDPSELKAYIDRQVKEKAKQEAENEIVRRQMLDEQQKFDLACNSIYERGSKEYGAEFDTSTKTLQQMGIMRPDSPILQAVIRMENGHQILKKLADDPMQVMELMDKSPYDQVLHLARMDVPRGTSVRASGAPPPIKPIAGAVGDAVPQPDANGRFPDQAAYRRWREAQK